MKKLLLAFVCLAYSLMAYSEAPTEAYFNNKAFTQAGITCEFPSGSSNTTQAYCTQNCESSQFTGFTTQQNKTVLFADGKTGTWSYANGKLTLVYKIGTTTTTTVFTDANLDNGKLVVKTSGANNVTCVFKYNATVTNATRANPNNFTQPKPAFK